MNRSREILGSLAILAIISCGSKKEIPGRIANFHGYLLRVERQLRRMKELMRKHREATINFTGKGAGSKIHYMGLDKKHRMG